MFFGNIFCWKTLYFIVALCAEFAFVQCVNSPCPSVFKYMKYKGEHVGLVNTPQAIEGQNELIVNMTVKLYDLPTNYIGKILIYTKDENVDELISKNKPLKFIVYFAVQKPRPKITLITYNGEELCRGAGDTGQKRLSITLNYILTSTITNSYTQEESYEYEPQNSYPLAEEEYYVPMNIRIAPEKSTFQTQTLQCGKPMTYSTGLIANGLSINPGDWPWIVALLKIHGGGAMEYFCAGTIISQSIVITAAHCVIPSLRKKFPLNRMIVQAGVLSLVEYDNHKLTETVRNIHFPESFRDQVDITMTDDIAALILENPLTYSNYILPICLWDGKLELPVGDIGHVLGWGKDELGSNGTIDPKLINVPIVSKEECISSNIKFTKLVKRRKFCAGNRDYSGPCSGDSGAGLVIRRGGRYELRGIVSFSLQNKNDRTCDLSNYVVYTDTPYFNDWMIEIINTYDI